MNGSDSDNLENSIIKMNEGYKDERSSSEEGQNSNLSENDSLKKEEENKSRNELEFK